MGSSNETLVVLVSKFECLSCSFFLVSLYRKYTLIVLLFSLVLHVSCSYSTLYPSSTPPPFDALKESSFSLLSSGNNIPPQNISNFYKGKWRHQEGTLYTSQTESGLFTIQAKMTERISKEFHFIEGAAVIRDGTYLHNKQWPFLVQGVYSIYSGHFHFYLVPQSMLLAKITGDNAKFNDTSAQHAYQIGMKQRMIKIIQQLSGRKWRDDPLNTCIYKGFMAARNEETKDHDFHYDDFLGTNCNSTMAVEQETMLVDVFYNRAINYSLMVTFIAFFEALALIYQMSYTRTQTSAARMSLLTLAQQAILDSYICLMHFAVGVYIEGIFKAFVVTAFIKFVLFSVFGMRYLIDVWKARRPNNFNGWAAMRRELQSLYIRVYGALIIGLFVVYQLNFLFQYFLFALYSFWVGQIYCNITRNAPKPLKPGYIIVFSISRLVIPLYLFGCPYNFISVQPNPILCICLVVWVFLQAAVLLIQHYFGPRCFVPKILLPAKYNYNRPIPPELLEDGECNCVICMSSVEQTDALVTPCSHVFHAACLTRWMEEKMECPSCRFPLPEL